MVLRQSFRAILGGMLKIRSLYNWWIAQNHPVLILWLAALGCYAILNLAYIGVQALYVWLFIIPVGPFKRDWPTWGDFTLIFLAIMIATASYFVVSLLEQLGISKQ